MTEGTKYHSLFEYLLFSGQGRLSMSFAEVESIIGASLPPSARKREEWWSNSPSGHSQARAWMRASYKASNVDLSGEKVVFSLEGWPDGYRTVNLGSLSPGSGQIGLGEMAQASYDGAGSAPTAGQNLDQAEHPLFGIWEGKVTLVADHDYTKPAFEPDAAS